MRLSPVLALLIATNAAVFASESIPVDFRVALTTMPETDSVEVSYWVPTAAVGVSGETENMRVGWRFEAGLVARFKELTPSLSLVGGAWFFYGDQAGKEYAPGGRDISVMTGPMEMTTMGVDLYAALAWQVSRYCAVEFGPFVGLGSARISDRGVNADNSDSRIEQSGSGDYEEAGLQLALLAHNEARTFLVGLGVRYLAAQAEAEFAFDTKDSQGNITNNGLHEKVEVRLNGFAPYLTAAITF